MNGKKASSLKPILIGAIQEVIEEVETVLENVAKGAGMHIHSTSVRSCFFRLARCALAADEMRPGRSF